jgi:hypothetical protein
MRSPKRVRPIPAMRLHLPGVAAAGQLPLALAQFNALPTLGLDADDDILISGLACGLAVITALTIVHAAYQDMSAGRCGSEPA